MLFLLLRALLVLDETDYKYKPIWANALQSDRDGKDEIDVPGTRKGYADLAEEDPVAEQKSYFCDRFLRIKLTRQRTDVDV